MYDAVLSPSCRSFYFPPPRGEALLARETGLFVNDRDKRRWRRDADNDRQKNACPREYIVAIS